MNEKQTIKHKGAKKMKHQTNVEFNKNFWNCKCRYDYVQPIGISFCSKCGTFSFRQSNSTVDEVHVYFLNFGKKSKAR